MPICLPPSLSCLRVKHKERTIDCSVVVSDGEDLLARRSEDQRVFHLGGERASLVAQRGVGSDDSVVDQILQVHQVTGLTHVIKPASAESEASKVGVDSVEEFLGSLESERDHGGVCVLHVMGDVKVLHHVPLPGRTEGLDGIELSFFHFRRFGGLHNRHRLPSVNPVRSDGVPIQISDRFDAMNLAVQLDLKGLDHFLDGLSDLRKPRIDARHLQAHPGSLLSCLDEVVKLGVECHRPCTVDDAASHLNSEVDLHDVRLLQDSLCVASLRCPMCCAVVQGDASGKSLACLETIGLDELLHLALNLLTNLQKGHTGTNELLRVPTNLSVALCGSSCVLEFFVELLFLGFHLGIGLSLGVLPCILNLLSDRIATIRKHSPNGNCGFHIRLHGLSCLPI
mmetsp:Transcript_33481/g.66387  ORF Transcript_33481/g.66387 Transcript_33481/m.66387 type:complete len:397 (-) Transcript_33481:425-1615(-)